MDPQYAAGFFDGEGCVRIERGVTKQGRAYYALHVVVVNTYLPILREFQAAFGGVVKARHMGPNKPQWRQSFMWRVCSRDAVKFLTVILPHLRQKREEAELAIKFQAGMRHLGNRYRLTPPEIVAEREAMYQAMTQMKRTEWTLN